jgi:F-type H+-transporting ATPase subunit b
MNINFTLVSQMIAFGIFIWFTVKFVWPPMLRAMENRQKTIADGLAAAERGKHELELSARRSADVLREAKQHAAEIIVQAERRGAQIVEEAKQSAKAEGDRIIAGAKDELDQEVYRVREALRAQVAALAVAGAEKILRREIDAKAHSQLLAQVQAEL